MTNDEKIIIAHPIACICTINQYARERTETEKLIIAQRALSNTDGQLIYTLEKNADGTINVYEGDPLVSNGIEGVTVNKLGAHKGIYNLNGMRMPSMKSGLNLIRQSDGSVRKILVK